MKQSEGEKVRKERERRGECAGVGVWVGDIQSVFLSLGNVDKWITRVVVQYTP